MFREYGIIPSGIVGGYEALSDHLIVTKNLATPHHKDTKDVYDSFSLWLQEDKSKEKKNWYFVLPNLELCSPNSPFRGVFIKLFHGVGIKWNGRKLVHFTSDEFHDEISDDVYHVFINASRGITLMKRILEIEKIDKKDTCCICLEELKSEQEEIEFFDCPKNHAYHAKCLIISKTNTYFEPGSYYACLLYKMKSTFSHPRLHTKRLRRCVICDMHFKSNHNARNNDEDNLIASSDNVYIYPCCKKVVHYKCHMYHASLTQDNSCTLDNESTGIHCSGDCTKPFKSYGTLE